MQKEHKIISYNECPTCNTTLRIFNNGIICQKNHKFLKDTQVYNNFLTKSDTIADTEKFKERVMTKMMAYHSGRVSQPTNK